MPLVIGAFIPPTLFINPTPLEPKPCGDPGMTIGGAADPCRRAGIGDPADPGKTAASGGPVDPGKIDPVGPGRMDPVDPGRIDPAGPGRIAVTGDPADP